MHANRLPLRLSTTLFFLGLWACVTPLSAATLYAVTSTQQLVRFDSATPGTFSSTVPITGVAVGETVLGIDLRPATGDLVALGSMNRVYRLNPVTGVATAIGSPGAFTLNGTSFGFDFNPVPDRIRVVSDAEQNLRLNPILGTLAANDMGLAYVAADPNFGQNPNVVSSAYTNSFFGTTLTTLFGIDSTFDVLVIQNPPNNGALNTVGPLGVNVVGNPAFDVLTTFGPTNEAFAALSTDGTSSALYSINLSTGTATLIGNIGLVATLVDGLAVVPPGTFVFSAPTYAASEGDANAVVTISRVGGSTGTVSVDFATSDGSATAPGDYQDSDQTLQFGPGVTSLAVMIPLTGDDEAWLANKTLNLALTNPTGGALLGSPLATTAVLTLRDDEAPNAYAITSGNQLIRFNLGAPEVLLTNIAISGTVGNEAVIGLDSRPLTRELFGLGVGSRLYRIDGATGVATQIGVDGAFTLSGALFGFDFNPTVDRVRVVSDTGQNLRLNPSTGALAANDVVLAYATGDVNQGQVPFVVGSGYTNSVAGTPLTTLYGIDAMRDVLVIQNPPNNGTLNTVGALGINAFDPVGFDLASTGVGREMAYAALSQDGVSSSLFSTNLATGTVTRVGAIGPSATLLRAFAIDDPHIFRNGFE